MRALTLGYGLLLVASSCVNSAPTQAVVDPGAGGATGGNGPSPGGGTPPPGGVTPTPPGGSTTVAGALTADATWSGLVTVTDDVTVDPGVTLTIADGALVQVASGKGLTVRGTLKIVGSAAGGVKLGPNPMPGSWSGIAVDSGGSVNVAFAEIDYAQTGLSCAAGAVACSADHLKVLHYSSTGLSVQSAATLSHVTVDAEDFGGGGIEIAAGASDTVSITDSLFHATGGDAVVCTSGNLTLQYSHVAGNAPGGNSGVHCATHLSTRGIIKMDHNLLENINYGIMAEGLSPMSIIEHNNFVGYGTPTTTPLPGGAWSAVGAGNLVGIDLTNNWWGDATGHALAPPTDSLANLSPTAAAPVAPVGPR
jgi:hypothetical protein